MIFNIHLKSFEELTVGEIYKIFQLRNDVFVVEQQCTYQDADGKDQLAHHLMLDVENQLAAYARLLPPGVSFPEMSIGRVITAKAFRSQGLGKQLMQIAIDKSFTLFGKCAIRISAQVYLIPFYNQFSFEQTGENYLEDGIPHIEMVKRVNTV